MAASNLCNIDAAFLGFPPDSLLSSFCKHKSINNNSYNDNSNKYTENSSINHNGNWK